MKLRSLFAAVLAICMLFACIGPVAAEGGKTEVVIWHTFTNDQDAALNEIADAFNASQDGITVVVQSQPYQNFENNVYTAVANGVGPDIIFNYASTAADYIEDGKVVDLGAYIDDAEIGIEGYAESLPAAIYEEASAFTDGKLHAMPVVTTGPIFFYNKTLYDELGLSVPTTWAELSENSKAIYEAKGIPGFAADSLTDFGQIIIMQNGSGYIDEESKTTLINNEKAIEMVEWFADNVKAGYFTLQPSGDYFSNDFNAQLVGSYIGSCAGVPYIIPDGFEYAMAPVPQDGEVNWYPSWNRSIIVFSTDEESDKAAYEFAKFFVNPENNTKWCVAMAALSPYSTTASSDEYKAFVEANPALAAVEANLENVGFLPSIPGSRTVRDELARAITMASTGSMTAAEALAEAETVCNEALQE